MSLLDVFQAPDRLTALSQLSSDEQLLAAVVITEETHWDNTDPAPACRVLAGVILACANHQVTHHVMNHAARGSARRHLFFEVLQLLNNGNYASIAEGCAKFGSNDHVQTLVNGAFEDEIFETRPGYSKVRRLPEALIAMAQIVSDKELLCKALHRKLAPGVMDTVVTRLVELSSQEEISSLLRAVRSQVRDSTWIKAALHAPMEDQLHWAFFSNISFVLRVGLMRSFSTEVLEEHLPQVQRIIAAEIRSVLQERRSEQPS